MKLIVAKTVGNDWRILLTDQIAINGPRGGGSGSGWVAFLQEFNKIRHFWKIYQKISKKTEKTNLFLTAESEIVKIKKLRHKAGLSIFDKFFKIYKSRRLKSIMELKVYCKTRFPSHLSMFLVRPNRSDSVVLLFCIRVQFCW